MKRNPAPRRGVYYPLGKRAFDVVVAGTVLVMTAPILCVAALALRLSLGKDIVFRQKRVGKDGRDFEMLKFRTMKHSRRREDRDGFDGPDRRQTHKHPNDPRHTRVGRLMRKTSIDELPQLINVLRGDMSLVGPRPELSTIVDKMELRDHGRHAVKPGMTGPWQISHRGTGIHLYECFDGDLDYVSRVSLRYDLHVIVGTVRVVLAGTGS